MTASLQVPGSEPGCNPETRCEFVTDWLPERRIECPYCGEAIVVVVDLSAGTQSYVEDCQVCCQPIDMHIEIDADELVAVRATRGP